MSYTFALMEPLRPLKEQANRLKEGFDELCSKAAHAVDKADVILIVTGAGFSADSGLAVYNDIARIKPYADRGLQYHVRIYITYLL